MVILLLFKVSGAGSCRIPSGFCGISTIKPSHALIAHGLSKVSVKI